MSFCNIVQFIFDNNNNVSLTTNGNDNCVRTPGLIVILLVLHSSLATLLKILNILPLSHHTTLIAATTPPISYLSSIS
jgi:hypothetical protein